MTRWLTYLKLETKKGMKFIPFFLMSILFAAGAVVLAAVLFCAVMDRRQLFPQAEIAVVLNSDGSDDTVESGGLGDIKTGMMIGVVESMSSVKSVCHFNYMSPKAAAEGLTDGTVDAAVYLPKGVYDDINNGGNTPVLVRLSAKNAALQGSVFRQLVADGVSLIRTVEAAIYAVDHVSWREEASVAEAASASGGEPFQLAATLTDAEDRIFNLYVACALDRTSIFSSSGVSAFGGMTMLQFYAVTALLLILLLFGIGFSAFYNEGERDTVRTLRRLGVHPVAADAAKVLAITAVLGVLLLIIFFFYGLISQLIPGSGTTAKEVRSLMPRALSTSGASLLRKLPLIAATAFSLAAAVHLLYTLAPAENAALIYLLIVAALFVLAGGILPVSWMPRGLRAVAARSPLQVWQGSLARLLYGAEAAVSTGGAGTAAALSGSTGAGAVLSPVLTGLLLLVPACLYQIAADILSSSRPLGEDAAQAAREQLAARATRGQLAAQTTRGPLAAQAAREQLAAQAAREPLAARAARGQRTSPTEVSSEDRPDEPHITPGSAAEPHTRGGSFRWLLRLRVLLARQLRSPAFWFIAALLLALQLVLGTLALPAADNSSIGIVNGGGSYAEAVTDDLLASEGAYSWILYENADALRAAVAAGTVDSGFVLDRRLDEAIGSGSDAQADAGSDSSSDLQTDSGSDSTSGAKTDAGSDSSSNLQTDSGSDSNGDLQTDAGTDSASGQAGDTGIQTPDLSDCIDYISSTSSTKGEAAKEDVFACLFAHLSPELLGRAIDAGAIFANPDGETKAAVLSEIQTVLAEETLFDVRFEAFPADDAEDSTHSTTAAAKTTADEKSSAQDAIDPADSAQSTADTTATAADTASNDMSSVTGVLLFAALLLFASAKFRRGSASVITYFRREGLLFQTMENFAPLLLVGLLSGVALVVIRAAGGSLPLLSAARSFTPAAGSAAAASLFAADIAGFLLLIPALLLAAVWAALFARLFRHETVYLFLSVALVLLAAALSPAADGISFLSSVRWVRYLLPASWFIAIL